jgi:hypothetical protein
MIEVRMTLFGRTPSLVRVRVGFTVAHQYLHQLEPDVRHAVLGNAGSIISFRVGVEERRTPPRISPRRGFPRGAALL